MEPIGGTEVGSAIEAFQLGDEIQRLVVAPPETANSFTALLEMSASQAAELLHSPETAVSPANFNVKSLYSHALHCAPAFPSDGALIERAAKYSVFATAGICGRGGEVKSEPAESGSNPNSSDPTDASENEKPLKRKEREKKGKGSSKKNKVTANRNIEDGEKLPYVHVRARRGQATDSHSLAERARREKINARMKFLQELVPGCNKISGTALVLDEIINHVQSLQRQVEYLSMRLAAVNPRIGFNIDSSLTGGSGTIMDCSYPSMAMPLVWPELQMNGERQHCQPQWHIESLNQPLWTKDDNQHSLVTPEHSLLSYDSSGNSGDVRC